MILLSPYSHWSTEAGSIFSLMNGLLIKYYRGIANFSRENYTWVDIGWKWVEKE